MKWMDQTSRARMQIHRLLEVPVARAANSTVSAGVKGAIHSMATEVERERLRSTKTLRGMQILAVAERLAIDVEGDLR